MKKILYQTKKFRVVSVDNSNLYTIEGHEKLQTAGINSVDYWESYANRIIGLRMPFKVYSMKIDSYGGYTNKNGRALFNSPEPAIKLIEEFLEPQYIACQMANVFKWAELGVTLDGNQI